MSDFAIEFQDKKSDKELYSYQHGAIEKILKNSTLLLTTTIYYINCLLEVVKLLFSLSL